MRFGKLEIKLDSQVEKLIDNAINRDNRNILILGQTGTGKTTLLNHITSICRNNKNIIDGEFNTNVAKMIEERTFDNSMCALGGVKTTAILDEFHRLKDGYNLLFEEYRYLYSNYVISVHGGGSGRDMEFLEGLVSRELIDWLNPIILKTVREWNSRAYTLEITDNGKEMYKGRVYNVEREGEEQHA